MEDTAINFALDFQENSRNASNCTEAIKNAMKEYIDKIDRTNSTDDTVAFLDGSSATWYGNGWTINRKEKSLDGK